MEQQIEEFVQKLTPEAKQKIAHALENYETPEAPKAPAPARITCTNNEKMHEDLTGIQKELHAIAQELEKINRTLTKRK